MLTLIIALVIAFFVFKANRSSGFDKAIVYALAAAIGAILLIPLVVDQLSSSFNSNVNDVVDAANTTAI